jgi:mono/diheme cytochrome c family protein
MRKSSPHADGVTYCPHPVKSRSTLKFARVSFRGVLLGLMLTAAVVSEDVPAAESVTPLERATRTPKGQLKSPYPDFATFTEEGYRKYMAAGCNGCHGGGGGGGMAAPLTNRIWIYGEDDDTLFRVIALGTGSLSPGNAFGKLGYRRKGSEAVVGPMPDFGEIIKIDDDLWKIIAWIRSVYCERRTAGC